MASFNVNRIKPRAMKISQTDAKPYMGEWNKRKGDRCWYFCLIFIIALYQADLSPKIIIVKTSSIEWINTSTLVLVNSINVFRKVIKHLFMTVLFCIEYKCFPFCFHDTKNWQLESPFSWTKTLSSFHKTRKNKRTKHSFPSCQN